MTAGLLGFNPPGPVAAAFMADRSELVGIMGPMGSGKTSACIMRSVQRAAEMPRSKVTGERLYKLGVVRNTLADMKRTTMKSVEGWFGAAGQWGGGGSSSEPPYFKVGFGLPDGSVARLWYDFVGLDTHSVEQLAKGWEITDYWLNEADLLPRDVWDFVDSRTGRYPGAQHGKPTMYGGMADYNAPDTENYAYTLFEELRPHGRKLYRQPGGRDPRAENLANLPEGYYDRLAHGKEEWWIRRNIDNLYGYSRDGKPVYPEYRDDFHCSAAELKPVEGLPIKVSFDQGLHPAAILRQTLPNGQRLILDEVYVETGATGLAEELRKLIATRYAGFRVIGGRCDPAGAARSGNDTESWIDCINRLMNWTQHAMVRCTETNDPDKRQASVRALLKRNVGDGRPALLISSRCKAVRKGFNSEYCFKRKRTSGGGYDDVPDKSKRPYADVHDALQYDCLDEGGFEDVVGRENRGRGFGSGKMFKAKMGVQV